MEKPVNFEKGKVLQIATWKAVAKNQSGHEWESGSMSNE